MRSNHLFLLYMFIIVVFLPTCSGDVKNMDISGLSDTSSEDQTNTNTLDKLTLTQSMDSSWKSLQTDQALELAHTVNLENFPIYVKNKKSFACAELQAGTSQIEIIDFTISASDVPDISVLEIQLTGYVTSMDGATEEILFSKTFQGETDLIEGKSFPLQPMLSSDKTGEALINSYLLSEDPQFKLKFVAKANKNVENFSTRTQMKFFFSSVESQCGQ